MKNKTQEGLQKSLINRKEKNTVKPKSKLDYQNVVQENINKFQNSSNDMLSNNFNFRKYTYSIGLENSPALAYCKLVYFSKISQAVAVSLVLTKYLGLLGCLSQLFVIRENFKFGYKMDQETGTIKTIDYSIQPGFSFIEQFLYNNAYIFLIIFSIWMILILIILLQVTTKFQAPVWLSSRFKILAVSHLTRGLDGWKGLGTFENLKFWRRSLGKKGSKSEDLESWKKLKIINEQTSSSLFFKCDPGHDPDMDISGIENLVLEDSSYRKYDTKDFQEQEICEVVQYFFLIHEYIMCPASIVWAGVSIKNLIAWTYSVKNDSSLTENEKSQLFGFFKQSKDPFHEYPILAYSRYVILAIGFFTLLWKKSKIKHITYNPLNSISTLRSFSDIVQLILEYSLFLMLLVDSATLDINRLIKALSCVLIILIFLMTIIQPNRTFQNVYGAEIFGITLWLLLTNLRNQLYQVHTANNNTSLIVDGRIIVMIIASVIVAQNYARWYFDFTKLSIEGISGASPTEFMKKIRVINKGLTMSDSKLGISKSRCVLQIYSLLNFITYTNGGDLNYPNSGIVPFLMDPSRENFEEKIMYIDGLEKEHNEYCKAINCRCREVLIKKELRQKKSDHDLRIFEQKFFVKLAIVRDVIKALVLKNKSDTQVSMLYCYFLSNFQNRRLVGLKLAQSKILKTNQDRIQKNTFSSQGYTSNSFEGLYFQYFQYQQTRNYLKTEKEYFTNIPVQNQQYISDLGAVSEESIRRIFDAVRIVDLIRLNLSVYIEYKKLIFETLAENQLNLVKALSASQICFEIEGSLDYIFTWINSKLKNPYPNFTIFECFYLIRVKNHHHKRVKMLNKFNQRMIRFQKHRRMLGDSLYKRFMDAQVCVISTSFNSSTGSYSKIQYSTKNSNKVIKHEPLELIGQDLNKLLPNLLTDIHQDFFQISLDFGQKQVHTDLQNSYLKAQDSSLIKVQMKLMLMPHISSESNELRVYSFISRKKSTKNSFLIMIDKGGQIKGVSLAARTFFGLEQSTIDRGTVSINYLSQEFDLLVSALNWRILLNINVDSINKEDKPAIGSSIIGTQIELEPNTNNRTNQPNPSILYDKNNLPDLVPLFFEKMEIAQICKWKPSIDNLLQKMHRSMYIEYKDPNRRMLKGGILVEQVASPEKLKKLGAGKDGPSKGPTRRRDSQRKTPEEMVEIKKATNKASKFNKTGSQKSILDLFNKKDVEIVKGLFKMIVSEQILPTFTIMRVIELKLVSDSLGKFNNILEKKRKGEITLADQIELGFDPNEMEIDPMQNFIIQIDKSVCMMRTKKNNIPKPLLDLEGKDGLIIGPKRYQYCMMSSEIESSKLLIYSDYLGQLKHSNNAYKKVLFSSKNDRKRAFEKMSSIQSLVNLNIMDDGSVTQINAVESTKSRTFNSAGAQNYDNENMSILNRNNKNLNKKLRIFNDDQEMNKNYLPAKNDQGIEVTNNSRLEQPTKQLDDLCNSKVKSKKLLRFFRLVIYFSIFASGLFNFIEVSNLGSYFKSRQTYSVSNFFITSINSELMVINAIFQLDMMLPKMIEISEEEKLKPGIDQARIDALDVDINTLRYFLSLNEGIMELNRETMVENLELLRSNFNHLSQDFSEINGLLFNKKRLNQSLDIITSPYLKSEYNLHSSRVMFQNFDSIDTFVEEVVESDRERQERLEKALEDKENDYRTEKVWENEKLKKKHGRIILKEQSITKAGQLAEEHLDFKLINPFDQLGLLYIDLLQVLNNKNPLSLMNLSYYHLQLLQAIQVKIDSFADEHFNEGQLFILNSMVIAVMLLYVPIIAVVVYILQYQRSLIQLFSKMAYLENQDLSMEIKLMDGLKKDLINIGDCFGDNSVGFSGGDQFEKEAVVQLLDDDEDEGGDFDEYSDEQRKNYAVDKKQPKYVIENLQKDVGLDGIPEDDDSEEEKQLSKQPSNLIFWVFLN